MADGELMTDRTPLLERKESLTSLDANQGIGFHKFQTATIEMRDSDGRYGAANTIDIADESPNACLPTFVEEECPMSKQTSDIVCIFAVAFDPRAGNIVEWHLPKDCNLDGIEFRAMASGLHRVQTDFIYFKRGRLYGLACFENMPVENAKERGARMKSLGVLATNYTSLHQHMNFLRQQVRLLLEHPGSYGAMERYYEENKGMLPTFEAFKDHNDTTSGLRQDILMLPLMRIMHPAGCFAQFMKFFSENIFSLWKMVLLKKRIIFFSPPPIGVVCYRVYCASCLSAHRIAELGSWEAQPLFYVNIADMDSLEGEKTYIACTTEKIFESKCYLYDLYVDNQNLKSETPNIEKMMAIGPSSRVKYTQLCKLQSQMSDSAKWDASEGYDEAWFVRYFMSLNEHLFSTLLSVSRTQERQFTEDHMHSIGLDPVYDRLFIMELAEIYGIDIIMMVDNACCPT